MANKNLFNSTVATISSVPATDGVNLAGGKAYSLSAKQALAQFAVTGTFNGTFYASGKDQLDSVKDLISKVDPEFIAKLAIYSRKSAFMKDMPAYLLATLSSRDVNLFKQTFPVVIDNMKMLRNFVQIMRSGVTGRKSLGSAPKKAIKAWLDSRTDEQLFNDSVGNDPSLADIVKMVHVKSSTESRNALLKYLMGFEGASNSELLPNVVKEFEAFKKNPGAFKSTPKNISFEMLTALPLTTDHWAGIASDAKWHMTRMNLNTFARHGVFTKSPEMVDVIASRLKDEKAIAKSKVFPYQLFAAYKQTLTNAEVPTKVKNALQDAMEISVKNVPNFGGKKIAVGVDISGSMRCAITGNRGSVTSQIMCNDVAALFAAALLRANEDTTSVFQFDTHCKPMKNLNARDSIMTNLSKIAFNGGGTDCSSTIRYLNDHKIHSDLVVIVSDNMSWIDMSGHYNGQVGTAMATAWSVFKKNNPKAKLVCLDLVPQTHVQVKPQADVLCVGGFSDNVFDVIKAFSDNTNNDPDFFVKTIQESV